MPVYFSESAVHTESKMIIFTCGPLQGLKPVWEFCKQSSRQGGGDD